MSPALLNQIYAEEKVELDAAIAALQWASIPREPMRRGEIWWATLPEPRGLRSRNIGVRC
jgi:hypothetical protein